MCSRAPCRRRPPWREPPLRISAIFFAELFFSVMISRIRWRKASRRVPCPDGRPRVAPLFSALAGLRRPEAAVTTLLGDARPGLRRQGMRLPAPQGDLRPVLRARHARDPPLHRLPAADRPPLPGRRRRRDRAREGRGPARLRRRRDPGRARRRARARGLRGRGLDRLGAARRIEPADLEGTFMAIAATNDTDVNIAVYEEAERRAMLVNVVDVPPLCNFILPAIVRTGPLAIAISTAGASPALAKRMKREIAEHVRRALRAAGDDPQRRPRLGQGDAAHLPGPQGVLRGDRQRRPRPGRAGPRRPRPTRSLRSIEAAKRTHGARFAGAAG